MNERFARKSETEYKIHTIDDGDDCRDTKKEATK